MYLTLMLGNTVSSFHKVHDDGIANGDYEKVHQSENIFSNWDKM